MVKSKIKELAKGGFSKTLERRRHIHANPELSFKEYNTSAYVRKELELIGIKDITACADTGLIALIKGKDPECGTTALRADLDALPIHEENKVDYRSVNEGVMHACGHDVHTSCLLGAAEILNSIKDDFQGTVKLIFQPGEERLPGGASKMIAEGVLKNPKVRSIIGQHVMPLIDAGKVGFRSGLYMASADEIYITIKGKGGHGAHPHQIIDPIAIAAQVITSLQQVVSRMAKPSVPSVLSIGKIIGNGSTNVIPAEVYMEGTFRTFNEEWRSEAHKRIVKVATEVTEALGGTCDIEVRRGYPYLENDPDLANHARNDAIAYLGEGNVEDLEIWPAGEDFAFYSHEVPACFYRLGIRNEKQGITSMLHTPTFNIDESALEVGTGLMAWLAVCELGRMK